MENRRLVVRQKVPRIQKDELRAFFEQWADQPAHEDLPQTPIWHLERKVTYRTCIVGCEIRLEIEVDERSILFAASLLPAIEAYAATALRAGLYPSRSLLRCRAGSTEGAAGMFLYESLEDECGDVTIDIKFDAGLVASRDALNSKNDANLALVSYIVFNAMLPPTEQTMQNLLGDGEALTRTILFLGLPLADGVVFGDDMRLHAEDWARYLEVSESFLMLRSTAWDRERVSKAPAAPVSDRSEEFQGLSGQDGLKHTHMVVGDVINVALWDRAKWGGTLAQVDRDGTVVVGLLFGDVEVGKKIFRGLRRRFGTVDTHDSLQLVFLTGIDATAPLHCRVLLAENWELLIASPKRTAGFMLTRTNTMGAQNTLVLDLMNKLRDQKGDFLLAPCALDAGGRPKVLLDYAIQKLSLSVVPAWTVGESSPWLMVLRPEDNVWVPEDVTDPPVTKALARLRSFKK